MPEPVEIALRFDQRFDLLALRKPRTIRRSSWFFGLMGLWSAIAAVSAAARQHWLIAALTFGTAAGCAFMWWALRRAMQRIPATARWVEELSNEPRPSGR